MLQPFKNLPLLVLNSSSMSAKKNGHSFLSALWLNALQFTKYNLHLIITAIKRMFLFIVKTTSFALHWNWTYLILKHYVHRCTNGTSIYGSHVPLHWAPLSNTYSKMHQKMIHMSVHQSQRNIYEWSKIWWLHPFHIYFFLLHVI